MSKRLAFWLLTLAGIVILGLAIWQTIQHWQWLDEHGLDGIVALDMMALGILTLVLPLHLREMMKTATPLEMVRDAIVRGVGMMLAFTLAGAVLLFIGFLFTIPARMGRPYLLIPGLLIIVPIAISVTDIIRGIIQRTPANLFWSWVKHSFETYYILLIQFGTIPIAFVLFPAGFFLQLMSIIEGAVRFFSATTPDSPPLLCNWFKVGEAACGPALISFHVGHLILAILALTFGERLLDKAADGYATGLEKLENRIEY